MKTHRTDQLLMTLSLLEPHSAFPATFSPNHPLGCCQAACLFPGAAISKRNPDSEVHMWWKLISPLAGFSSTAPFRTPLLLLPKHNTLTLHAWDPLPAGTGLYWDSTGTAFVGLAKKRLLSFHCRSASCCSQTWSILLEQVPRAEPFPLLLYMAAHCLVQAAQAGTQENWTPWKDKGICAREVSGELDQVCKAGPCTDPDAGMGKLEREIIPGHPCPSCGSWAEPEHSPAVRAAGHAEHCAPSTIKSSHLMLQSHARKKENASNLSVFLNILFYHRETVTSIHGRAVILNGAVWNRMFL